VHAHKKLPAEVGTEHICMKANKVQKLKTSECITPICQPYVF